MRLSAHDMRRHPPLRLAQSLGRVEKPERLLAQQLRDAQRCSHQGRHEDRQDEGNRETSGPARSASPGPVAPPRSSCHEPDRA